MEAVCCGWLVKSPPEQKSSGAWKLFAAKWKRRYFVLYAPPASSAIIGGRAAILEYYSSKKLNTKVGAINLEDCDEVLSNLDSDIYKNVFGLHTKHKGRYRTYYLVADTEEEMNGWVSNLCRVLGLLENDETKFQFSPENRIKSASCILTKPTPNFTTHPNFVHRQNINSMALSFNSSSAFSSLSSRLNSSESDLLDSKLFSPLPEEEKKIKSSGSVPELENIHGKSVLIKKRENVELPPIPPEKTRKSLEGLIGDPKDGEVKQIAPISNLMAEECLGAPPPKPPKERKKSKSPREEYNVPKSLEADLPSYDLPKSSSRLSIEYSNIKALQPVATCNSPLYNAPKLIPHQTSPISYPIINLRNSPIPASRKSVSSKNLDNLKLTDVNSGGKLYSAPKSNSMIYGGAEIEFNERSFYNVPPSHVLLEKGSGSSFEEFDSSYDVPKPSSAEVQPVKGRKEEKLQRKIPVIPPEEESRMYDSPKAAFKPVPAKRIQISSQVYSSALNHPTSPKKPELPAKPVISKKILSKKLSQTSLGKPTDDGQTYSFPKPGGHMEGSNSFKMKLAAASMIQSSIRFTQRSKSFKRSLNGQEFDNEKQVKRSNDTNEASSDDCDSEDEC